jgi:hypothetical protein
MHIDHNGIEIKAGYKTINGGVMTAEDAARYNAMTDEITWKESQGRDCNYLRDCRHVLFCVIAGLI